MMNVNEILTNLWLGDIIDSKNSKFIHKVDIIINCTKNLPFCDKNKKCIRINVEDNLQEKEINALYHYFEPISKYVHSMLRKGKVILVHCYAGKQRSASIVCAYLMKYLNLDLNEAKYLISTKRKHIFTPLPNFEKVLVLYENELKNK